MCNFGESDSDGAVDPAVALAEHLAELDPATEHLHLGPGGSFYDEHETPRNVRHNVLRVLASLPRLETLGLETRPNLVSLDELRETLADLPPTINRLILGFGVECWNDLLREIAVNKGYSRSSVLRAAEIVAELNAEQDRVHVEFETYVLLKPTLLHEREGVEEALRTIDWSFRIGASTTAVFMNTIKDATVQGHLAARTDLEPPIRYQTPYLRSAVEVLRRLPPAQQARTAVLGLQSGIMASEGPRGCDRCYPFLLGAIYAHTFLRSSEVIQCAATSWCPCRAEWEREMAFFDPSPLHDRAARLIAAMNQDGYG
jgi:radical SAM enzyme (TIGR01210 family)